MIETKNLRIIIGYGNPLRGEDAFGIDVLKALKQKDLKETKLIEVFQLTPELALELLEATKIVFVDATYSKDLEYTLATPLKLQASDQLSHHISPLLLMQSLEALYGNKIEYEVFSMMTSHFESIANPKEYFQLVSQVVVFLGLD